MEQNTEYQYTIFKTNWGYFGLCSTDKGIFRTCLPVSSKLLCHKILTEGLDHVIFKKSLYASLQKAVKDYYKGACVDFKPSVDWSQFTPFTRKVLHACMKVSCGNTMTYKKLGQLAGHPKAARAVGAVMARNPIPLLIPCHRILSSDGQLRGFSAPGGLKTKQKMLALEKNRVCSSAANRMIKLP